LSGDADAMNTFDHPKTITPVTSGFEVKKLFGYSVPPMSLTVIRIKTRK
jgi:alpha-L-arabinofuranosidase